ncbi:MAG: DUF4209 domain-containing protein [Promethearchaeota archaeon]
MDQLNESLLDKIKEAITDYEEKKYPSLSTSFKEKLKLSKKTNNKELELLLTLLLTVFSSYYLQSNKRLPFGPTEELPDGSRVMMLEKLEGKDLDNLEKILAVTENPEFNARICDVLWIRKKDYAYAKNAILSYVECLEKNEEDLEITRIECLRRAMQISLKIKDRVQIDKVKIKIFDLFEKSRKTCFNPQTDYLPYNLVQIIVENKLADNWEELGDKLIEIAKGFPISPGCDAPRAYYDLAAKCYHYAKQFNKEKDAKLSIAHHFEQEALCFNTPNTCDGFNMAYRIQKAIDAYRKVEGQKEKVDQLIIQLKEANKMTLNQAKCITGEIKVDDILKNAEDNMKGKEGKELITSFILLYKPSSYQEVKELVENINTKFPIQSLMSETVIVPEGNISVKNPGMIDNSEERIKQDIVKQYNLQQKFIGFTIFRKGISIILNSNGTWKSAIKGLVKNSIFVPRERSYIYERALLAGINGDCLMFLHLIIPQLENSVRYVFGLNKFKTTSTQQTGVQRERDLNQLLEDKNAEILFGKDLLWEMKTLLVEQNGPNIRNRLCHGLMNINEINSEYTIFLLWLATFLLFCFKKETTNSNE